MGKEIKCRMQYQHRTLTGKAYLESDHILFRGEERLQILFKDLRSVATEAGILHLDFPGGPVSLELGAAAEKWAGKILHPPSRADKLGIKPGVCVRLAGQFDTSFLDDLSWVELATGKIKADLIFLAAEDRGALARIPKLAAALTPAGALWVVYPKGVQLIREIEVLDAGRAAGLKDIEALKAGTSLDAELLGVAARTGSLEAGKFADIVACPGNPEQDIRQVEHICFVDERRCDLSQTRGLNCPPPPRGGMGFVTIDMPHNRTRTGFCLCRQVYCWPCWSTVLLRNG
jgi:hypothetical protein